MAGEEQTNNPLGGLGMGALNNEEAIEIDENTNQPINKVDAEGNKIPLDQEESQEGTQETEENNPSLQDELSDVAQEGESKEPEAQGDQEESPSEEGSSGSSPNPYLSLASALRDEGALQNIADEKLNEVEDASSLVNLITEEFESSKNDYLQNLEGTAKEVAEAIEAGVDPEDFRKAKSEEIEYTQLSDSDLEGDEEKQKSILETEFKNRGFSESRAQKFVRDLEHTGELEEEAKNSLKTLQEEKKKETEQLKEQAKEKERQQEEQRKEQLKQLESNIKEKQEIIPGMEINENMKSKVYNSMTTPVDQDDQGNPLDAVMKSWTTDPDYPIKVHYLHQLTNGFTDFSKLINGSKKEAVKDLEKAVKTGGKQTAGNPKPEPEPSNKDWSSILGSSE